MSKSKKVLKPTCLRCENDTLAGESYHATVQIENGKYTSTQDMGYTLCQKCKNEYGTILRIWRRSGKEDVAYFSKDRHLGVKIERELLLYLT
jgi:hypothetical protein